MKSDFNAAWLVTPLPGTKKKPTQTVSQTQEGGAGAIVAQVVEAGKEETQKPQQQPGDATLVKASEASEPPTESTKTCTEKTPSDEAVVQASEGPDKEEEPPTKKAKQTDGQSSRTKSCSSRSRSRWVISP